MTATSASAPVLEMARPSAERRLLALTNVSKRFGGVRALENVGFDVQRGHLLGSIGPNGSGTSCAGRLGHPSPRSPVNRVLSADDDAVAGCPSAPIVARMTQTASTTVSPDE